MTASPCVTCELVERRDRGEAPLWDSVRRTPRWDVVHAFGTEVAGWMVLVVRRHITSVADLTEEEARELGELVKHVSRAVQDVIGCDKTYVVQFAEHPDHPHVHVHVIPRARDLAEQHQGPRIFELAGADGDRAVSEERMNEVAEAVRRELDGIL